MAQYRVAVIADIHGNDAALDAVLTDLATEPHDALVIAGDLVLNGPRPAESLTRVRALGVPTIYGNADQYLFDPLRSGEPDIGRTWVRERIGAEGIAYLAALPFAHRLTPPGGVSPEDDLLIIHATPTDVEGVLVTEATATLSITPETEAIALLGDAQANLIVHGHIHCASFGWVGMQRVASVGSVGFPFDGDRRAAYALVSWDGENWQVSHRRVAYAWEAVIAELGQSAAPFSAISVQRLRQAQWIPMR